MVRTTRTRSNFKHAPRNLLVTKVCQRVSAVQKIIRACILIFFRDMLYICQLFVFSHNLCIFYVWSYVGLEYFLTQVFQNSGSGCVFQIWKVGVREEGSCELCIAWVLGFLPLDPRVFVMRRVPMRSHTAGVILASTASPRSSRARASSPSRTCLQSSMRSWPIAGSPASHC